MYKNKSLKAVIFDLDGVITDSARFHYAAWKELANRLNIPFDLEYNEKLKGVSRMESLDLILKNGGQENSFTQTEKEKMADEKNENYKQLIKQITKNDILPGILPFLQQLKSENIRTAIASVSKNAFDIISRLEVGEYFDYIVDAALVERAKPFPDIFLEAAKALDVSADECIAIEDARAGIDAINSAGMGSVGVGTKEEMEKADLILSGTDKLELGMLMEFFHLKR